MLSKRAIAPRLEDPLPLLLLPHVRVGALRAPHAGDPPHPHLLALSRARLGVPLDLDGAKVELEALGRIIIKKRWENEVWS